MENKTFYGNVIGWILGGCFWGIGLINLFFAVFIQHESVNFPLLLLLTGFILFVLLHVRIRFDEHNFSRVGPFFMIQHVEYENILQLHFEYRDRKFPELPTSVQYQLHGGEWRRFESGLFSAKVQKQIAEEFQKRIRPDLRQLEEESTDGLRNLYFRLRRARLSMQILFPAAALVFIAMQNVFAYIPAVFLLIFSIRYFFVRLPFPEQTQKYLKTFPPETHRRLFEEVHQKILPPMRAAGKITHGMRVKADRFAAFYPSFPLSLFPVIDLLEKKFFFRTFFRAEKPGTMKDAIPFEMIDFLVAGQLGKSLTVGIIAVLKDGRCYGFGTLKNRGLALLDQVLPELAEKLGHVPITFI